MVAGLAPRKRIRCKTSSRLLASPKPAVSKTKSQPSSRVKAVHEGLIPKARKAFALYLMEHTAVHKGAPKEAFLADMKKVGRMWAVLPDEQKNVYKVRSQQEFQAQQDAMMRVGLHVRQKLRCSAEPNAAQAGCRGQQPTRLVRSQSLRCMVAKILCLVEGHMAKCFHQFVRTVELAQSRSFAREMQPMMLRMKLPCTNGSAS